MPNTATPTRLTMKSTTNITANGTQSGIVGGSGRASSGGAGGSAIVIGAAPRV